MMSFFPLDLEEQKFRPTTLFVKHFASMSPGKEDRTAVELSPAGQIFYLPE